MTDRTPAQLLAGSHQPGELVKPPSDRLPWPLAARVIAGLSLLGWLAILTLMLPVIA